jgi:hypothetical protein
MPAGFEQFVSTQGCSRNSGFASLGDDVLSHGTAVIVDCRKILLDSSVRIDPFVIAGQ